MSSEDVPVTAALGGRYDAAALHAELGRKHAVVSIAERDGIVAGYLVTWHVGDSAEIHHVFVAEAHRRAGVGRALIRFIAREVKELTLEVRRDNEPAIALYVECGFQRVGERARYYADGEDAWLMTFTA